MSITKTCTIAKAEANYILRDIFYLDENDCIFQSIKGSKITKVEQLLTISCKELESMKCK